MGITGLKYIEITGGTNSSAALKAGSEIPTKKSMMSSITGKAEVIMAKVELLLNNLNEISNPDSLKSIRQILGNMEAISSDVRIFIKETGPQVNKLASSTTGIITKIDSIAADIKMVTGTFSKDVPIAKIGDIINKVDSTTLALKTLSENLSMMIRQTREDFTVSMQNVRQASENASQLTKTLAENPSLLLRNETLRERNIR
jgi:phospholipid/cholesterol/gamma-HCH transport system substrate-binding protein